MRLPTALLWMVALTSFAAAQARADDVLLKNGNTLTGTITRINPTTVDLTTDFAGILHVKRETVQSLRTTEQVTLVAADGTEHKTFAAPSEDWVGWHEATAAVAITSPPPARPPAVTPIALPRQTGPVVIGYLGSSTWALNRGSGQVPTLIDAQLKAAYPGIALTTINGSVSGTRTADYLPEKPNQRTLKTALQAQTGYKILRLMIGSNDAAAGMTNADWQANMQTIIRDALTWPVDQIVLEEIGARTDKSQAGLDLIRQYNVARTALLGPKVILGTAHSLQNQLDHLETLGSDHIHQIDAGQILLAGTQAAEMARLFSDATTSAAQAPTSTRP